MFKDIFSKTNYFHLDHDEIYEKQEDKLVYLLKMDLETNFHQD